MKYKEILKQVASKGTLIGQCAEFWLKENKNIENCKFFILECSEMTETEWIRTLWGESLVKEIRQYAKNYRGKKKLGTSIQIRMGETIQNLRKEKRIKQEALAESIDISQGHLSRIESGDYELSFSQVEKISFALGVPSNQILNGF